MGPIAQSVEQRTFNPWVDGSSPSGPTKDLEVKFTRQLIVFWRDLQFWTSVIHPVALH